MKTYLCLLILCLLSSTSLAKPDQIPAMPFKLVGQAQLKVFVFAIFKSALYTTDGKYTDTTKALKLTLRYQREISAKQLIKQTQKEWLHLKMKHPNKQQWIKQLTDIWPNIEKNDELTLTINHNGESAFHFNGKPIGEINDQDFGKQFAAIWLSKNTSKPKHRAKLLGLE